jgi:uncharacterized membrane protein YheB (UPF0754 family)
MMLTALKPYIPFLLPPLLGALIGYVTNYVAIRMLFRPLRPWYIWGVRVPMTPGIIPSRREDLARKMGLMVGEHLLTSADVGGTLDKPEFRTKVHEALAQKMDTFMQSPLGAPITLVPRRLQRRLAVLLGHISSKAGGKIGAIIQSAIFAQRIEKLSTQAVEHLLGRELRQVLGPKHYRQLRDNSATILNQWLHQPETRSQMERWLDTQLDRVLQSDKSLNDVLPADLKTMLAEKIKAQIPSLGTELIRAMRSGTNRTQLEQMARDGVDTLINSVEGLAALVGALFDINIIYKRLPEFIDTALDNLEEWLQTETAQESIAAVAQARMEEMLQRPVTEWIEGLSYAEVTKLKHRLGAAAYTFLTSEAIQTRALGLLDAAFKNNAGRTLGELSAPFLGDTGHARAQHLGIGVSRHILAYLRSTTFSRTSSVWMERQARHMVYERPLGILAEYIPSDARAELYQGLMRQFILVLKKELPPLVEGLNIARMVEEKVNNLDILQVEELLMGIMREQFRYINLFGALLGFLIGLLNLILPYL